MATAVKTVYNSGLGGIRDRFIEVAISVDAYYKQYSTSILFKYACKTVGGSVKIYPHVTMLILRLKYILLCDKYDFRKNAERRISRNCW